MGWDSLKLSDLDSLTIFIGGGILKLSDLDSLTIFTWGGILKLSDLYSLTIFIGGYSETLGFGLSDNFHLGGGILRLMDLDSLTIFILGGYSETLGFGLSDNFHWGGYSETVLQNGGILHEFGPKFQPLQQAHASQIVSHILRMWRLMIYSEEYTNFAQALNNCEADTKSCVPVPSFFRNIGSLLW